MMQSSEHQLGMEPCGGPPHGGDAARIPRRNIMSTTDDEDDLMVTTSGGTDLGIREDAPRQSMIVYTVEEPQTPYGYQSGRAVPPSSGGSTSYAPRTLYTDPTSSISNVEEIIVDTQDIHLNDGDYIVTEDQVNLDNLAEEVEIRAEETAIIEPQVEDGYVMHDHDYGAPLDYPPAGYNGVEYADDIIDIEYDSTGAHRSISVPRAGQQHVTSTSAAMSRSRSVATKGPVQRYVERSTAGDQPGQQRSRSRGRPPNKKLSFIPATNVPPLGMPVLNDPRPRQPVTLPAPEVSHLLPDSVQASFSASLRPSPTVQLRPNQVLRIDRDGNSVIQSVHAPVDRNRDIRIHASTRLVGNISRYPPPPNRTRDFQQQARIQVAQRLNAQAIRNHNQQSPAILRRTMNGREQQMNPQQPMRSIAGIPFHGVRVAPPATHQQGVYRQNGHFSRRDVSPSPSPPPRRYPPPSAIEQLSRYPIGSRPRVLPVSARIIPIEAVPEHASTPLQALRGQPLLRGNLTREVLQAHGQRQLDELLKKREAAQRAATTSTAQQQERPKPHVVRVITEAELSSTENPAIANSHLTRLPLGNNSARFKQTQTMSNSAPDGRSQQFLLPVKVAATPENPNRSPEGVVNGMPVALPNRFRNITGIARTNIQTGGAQGTSAAGKCVAVGDSALEPMDVDGNGAETEECQEASMKDSERGSPPDCSLKLINLTACKGSSAFPISLSQYGSCLVTPARHELYGFVLLVTTPIDPLASKDLSRAGPMNVKYWGPNTYRLKFTNAVPSIEVNDGSIDVSLPIPEDNDSMTDHIVHFALGYDQNTHEIYLIPEFFKPCFCCKGKLDMRHHRWEKRQVNSDSRRKQGFLSAIIEQALGFNRIGAAFEPIRRRVSKKVPPVEHERNKIHKHLKQTGQTVTVTHDDEVAPREPPRRACDDGLRQLRNLIRDIIDPTGAKELPPVYVPSEEMPEEVAPVSMPSTSAEAIVDVEEPDEPEEPVAAPVVEVKKTPAKRKPRQPKEKKPKTPPEARRSASTPKKRKDEVEEYKPRYTVHPRGQWLKRNRPEQDTDEPDLTASPQQVEPVALDETPIATSPLDTSTADNSPLDTTLADTTPVKRRPGRPRKRALTPDDVRQARAHARSARSVVIRTERDATDDEAEPHRTRPRRNKSKHYYRGGRRHKKLYREGIPWVMAEKEAQKSHRETNIDLDICHVLHRDLICEVVMNEAYEGKRHRGSKPRQLRSQQRGCETEWDHNTEYETDYQTDAEGLASKIDLTDVAGTSADGIELDQTATAEAAYADASGVPSSTSKRDEPLTVTFDDLMDISSPAAQSPNVAGDVMDEETEEPVVPLSTVVFEVEQKIHCRKNEFASAQTVVAETVKESLSLNICVQSCVVDFQRPNEHMNTETTVLIPSTLKGGEESIAYISAEAALSKELVQEDTSTVMATAAYHPPMEAQKVSSSKQESVDCKHVFSKENVKEENVPYSWKDTVLAQDSFSVEVKTATEEVEPVLPEEDEQEPIEREFRDEPEDYYPEQSPSPEAGEFSDMPEAQFSPCPSPIVANELDQPSASVDVSAVEAAPEEVVENEEPLVNEQQIANEPVMISLNCEDMLSNQLCVWHGLPRLFDDDGEPTFTAQDVYGAPENDGEQTGNEQEITNEEEEIVENVDVNRVANEVEFAYQREGATESATIVVPEVVVLRGPEACFESAVLRQGEDEHAAVNEQLLQEQGEYPPGTSGEEPAAYFSDAHERDGEMREAEPMVGEHGEGENIEQEPAQYDGEDEYEASDDYSSDEDFSSDSDYMPSGRQQGEIEVVTLSSDSEDEQQEEQQPLQVEQQEQPLQVEQQEQQEQQEQLDVEPEQLLVVEGTENAAASSEPPMKYLVIDSTDEEYADNASHVSSDGESSEWSDLEPLQGDLPTSSAASTMFDPFSLFPTLSTQSWTVMSVVNGMAAEVSQEDEESARDENPVAVDESEEEEDFDQQSSVASVSELARVSLALACNASALAPFIGLLQSNPILRAGMLVINSLPEEQRVERVRTVVAMYNAILSRMNGEAEESEPGSSSLVMEEEQRVADDEQPAPVPEKPAATPFMPTFDSFESIVASLGLKLPEGYVSQNAQKDSQKAVETTQTAEAGSEVLEKSVAKHAAEDDSTLIRKKEEAMSNAFIFAMPNTFSVVAPTFKAVPRKKKSDFVTTKVVERLSSKVSTTKTAIPLSSDANASRLPDGTTSDATDVSMLEEAALRKRKVSTSDADHAVVQKKMRTELDDGCASCMPSTSAASEAISSESIANEEAVPGSSKDDHLFKKPLPPKRARDEPPLSVTIVAETGEGNRVLSVQLTQSDVVVSGETQDEELQVAIQDDGVPSEEINEHDEEMAVDTQIACVPMDELDILLDELIHSYDCLPSMYLKYSKETLPVDLRRPVSDVLIFYLNSCVMTANCEQCVCYPFNKTHIDVCNKIGTKLMLTDEQFKLETILKELRKGTTLKEMKSNNRKEPTAIQAFFAYWADFLVYLVCQVAGGHVKEAPVYTTDQYPHLPVLNCAFRFALEMMITYYVLKLFRIPVNYKFNFKTKLTFIDFLGEVSAEHLMYAILTAADGAHKVLRRATHLRNDGSLLGDQDVNEHSVLGVGSRYQPKLKALKSAYLSTKLQKDYADYTPRPVEDLPKLPEEGKRSAPRISPALSDVPRILRVTNNAILNLDYFLKFLCRFVDERALHGSSSRDSNLRLINTDIDEEFAPVCPLQPGWYWKFMRRGRVERETVLDIYEKVWEGNLRRHDVKVIDVPSLQCREQDILPRNGMRFGGDCFVEASHDYNYLLSVIDDVVAGHDQKLSSHLHNQLWDKIYGRFADKELFAADVIYDQLRKHSICSLAYTVMMSLFTPYRIRSYNQYGHVYRRQVKALAARITDYNFWSMFFEIKLKLLKNKAIREAVTKQGGGTALVPDEVLSQCLQTLDQKEHAVMDREYADKYLADMGDFMPPIFVFEEEELVTEQGQDLKKLTQLLTVNLASEQNANFSLFADHLKYYGFGTEGLGDFAIEHVDLYPTEEDAKPALCKLFNRLMDTVEVPDRLCSEVEILASVADLKTRWNPVEKLISNDIVYRMMVTEAKIRDLITAGEILSLHLKHRELPTPDRQQSMIFNAFRRVFDSAIKVYTDVDRNIEKTDRMPFHSRLRLPKVYTEEERCFVDYRIRSDNPFIQEHLKHLALSGGTIKHPPVRYSETFYDQVLTSFLPFLISGVAACAKPVQDTSAAAIRDAHASRNKSSRKCALRVKNQRRRKLNPDHMNMAYLDSCLIMLHNYLFVKQQYHETPEPERTAAMQKFERIFNVPKQICDMDIMALGEFIQIFSNAVTQQKESLRSARTVGSNVKNQIANQRKQVDDVLTDDDARKRRGKSADPAIGRHFEFVELEKIERRMAVHETMMPKVRSIRGSQKREAADLFLDLLPKRKQRKRAFDDSEMREVGMSLAKQRKDDETVKQALLKAFLHEATTSDSSRRLEIISKMAPMAEVPAPRPRSPYNDSNASASTLAFYERPMSAHSIENTGYDGFPSTPPRPDENPSTDFFFDPPCSSSPPKQHRTSSRANGSN